jgi:UDP-glucose 4-epimerase
LGKDPDEPAGEPVLPAGAARSEAVVAPSCVSLPAGAARSEDAGRGAPAASGALSVVAPSCVSLPAGAVIGVTGATGHIGAVLLERLLRHEQVEVRSVARRPLVLGSAVQPGTSGRLVHTTADVRSEAARRALAGADLVFHLAAQVWLDRHAPPWARREAMRSVNVEGTANVLAAGAGAVVLASSAAVYGAWPDNPLPLAETDPARPNPECPYAEDKLAAEQACARQPGLDWVALRICPVLGPHADARVARSLAGYRLAVPEIRGCPQATQWLDEDDVAGVLLRAGADLLGQRTVVGEVINAATDDWVFATDIARVAGSRVVRAPRGLVVGAAELAWRAGLSPFGSDRAALISGPLALSPAKAGRLLSWRPTRTSEQVLAAALRRGWRGAPRNRGGGRYR